ncbi:hypothetical protein QQP08_004550 [Theobroma cacao]|nr:hypothetical protein QQP08_004550 [Theobroma cacao]
MACLNNNCKEVSIEKKMIKEEESYTLDGAVDRHGRPAIRGRTGTWVAGILLLGLGAVIGFNLRILTQA